MSTIDFRTRFEGDQVPSNPMTSSKSNFHSLSLRTATR